ncbi:hypothetical protein EDB82DRAFT_558955 [Fusarium venenatum]|uniref:uncharacterized protein n=1 Tax=Fusarium venenatum TaxID=56646 RepID=UPI001D7887E0|nr:hypothetical protein EDB82DRAFT_558955 [Fusarium venenatum]
MRIDFDDPILSPSTSKLDKKPIPKSCCPKTSSRRWEVYDWPADKVIKQDRFNSPQTWTQQILPISKGCALHLLGHYPKGYSLNRICRTVLPGGETGLEWNYRILLSSKDSTLRHVTLSQDGKNVTGLLGDPQQQLTVCIWDLSLEWFADEHVVALPKIKPPVTIGLQQENVTGRERTLGLVSTGQTVVVIKGEIGTLPSYHADFQNTASYFHGDDSKDSFFTDTKISTDGKLLCTRIARTPDFGEGSAPDIRRETWTDIETMVLKVEGLEIVHRFKEVWNADFTKPVALSIFFTQL